MLFSMCCQIYDIWGGEEENQYLILNLWSICQNYLSLQKSKTETKLGPQ